MRIIIFLIFVVNSVCLSQNFWKQTNGPYGFDSTTKSIAINSNNFIFAGTARNGIFRSSDNGENWQLINPDIFSLALAINSEDHVFAGTDGVLYRSTNNGETWGLLLNGWPFRGLMVLGMTISAHNHILAGGSLTYGTYEGNIYHSTNNGNSWTRRDNGIPVSSVLSLVSNTDSLTFAGTNLGVYLTTNAGENWLIRNYGLTNTLIRALAINSSGHIFAGTASPAEIFRSTNNGNGWTKVFSGINSRYINCITINSLGYIYAGSDSNGVLQSTDNGENWTPLNDGLSVSNILSLVVNSNGYLFAGTSGGGVFKSSYSTTSVEEENMLPRIFLLNQNYPNPFNPKTKISYSVPQTNFVTIIVYDLIGKEIATLVNEQKTIGNYEVEFDGSNLSSGIYFYKMRAGDFSDTKKFTLIK